MKPWPPAADINRKAIHIFALVIPFGWRYVMHSHRLRAVTLLGAMAVASLVIEILRIKKPGVRRLYNKFFGKMLKRQEAIDLTGFTYMLSGSIIAIAFLPADMAFCAIAFLILGDAAAWLAGKRLGYRHWLGQKKTLEGSLACFLVTFIFGAFYLHPMLAFAGALAATVAEALPIQADDNLTMPLAAGTAMVAASLFPL